MGSLNDVAQRTWSAYTDEELAWLAQHEELRRAWEEVRRRTLHWVAPLVIYLVRRLPLRDAELPDAQQIADLAIYEALDRFDLAQLNGPNPCHLTTFLNRMVRSRVFDFAQRMQRLERPYDRKLTAAGAAETVGDARKSPRDEDPAKLAADREAWERVKEALAQLPELPRQVLERWAHGETVQEIAEDLGQPYKKIWDLKAKTTKQLRAQLRGSADGDAG